MTDEILKEIEAHIAGYKALLADSEIIGKSLARNHVDVLQALYVAVSLCREVAMDKFIYDGSIHDEAEEALTEIATILGLKGDPNAKP
jgi:hypothetical protein